MLGAQLVDQVVQFFAVLLAGVLRFLTHIVDRFAQFIDIALQ